MISSRFYRLIVVIYILLVCSCSTGRMAVEDWKDPGIDKVWPNSPDSPRIQLLRVIKGQSDISDENKNEGFFGWLLGEVESELPLISPYGITADGQGKIWVADPGGGFVKIFDLVSKSVDYLDHYNDNSLVAPVDVAFDEERQRLYVADPQQAAVVVFDDQNRFISTLAPMDGFGRPGGMTLDIKGNLYVADVLKGVVDVFDPAGHFIKSIGSLASESGLFSRPTNVAVDADDRLFVVDSLRFQVEIQSPEGTLVNVIGNIGKNQGSFARPRGIAVDSFGHIYVADAAFDNIQVFDLAGNLLMFFGSPGNDVGEFCLPAGLYIDRADRIYVAESCNYRVQVFQYVGANLH